MRGFIGTFLLMLIFTSVTHAEDLSGKWGLGCQFGQMKLVGGENDYSNVDQFAGLWIRHGVSSHWSFDLTYRYGYTRPGAFIPGQDAGFSFETSHAFYTTMNHASLGTRFHFNPDRSFNIYTGFDVGYLMWNVRDENGNIGVPLIPDGPTVIGLDVDGNQEPLESANITLGFSLGTELFLSRNISVGLSTRYSYLIDNSLDNVGMSALWGSDGVDNNSGLLESLASMTIYFGGNNDDDGDGILNDDDFCPEEAEDMDGFQDEDGCPDLDNDGDGVPDTVDECPGLSEDWDGFEDDDGCPDPDNDADGIIDAWDQCPDEAEDMDGFEDEDGCPEWDNDRDGILDASDQCSGTPAGVPVGVDGCPKVGIIPQDMVLEGVSFMSGAAILTSGAKRVLDGIAESLNAYPAVKVEIQGYTDSRGSKESNRQLSQDRANAVRSYLIAKGVSSRQMQAYGYGEEFPRDDNNTYKGRVANRRVELKRIN